MESDEGRRTAAISRLRDKRELKQHALIYVAVNALLIIVWAASGAGYFWPIWVIGGWGIGLALHAGRILGQRPITEEEILAETRRLKRTQRDGA